MFLGFVLLFDWILKSNIEWVTWLLEMPLHACFSTFLFVFFPFYLFSFLFLFFILSYASLSPSTSLSFSLSLPSSPSPSPTLSLISGLGIDHMKLILLDSGSAMAFEVLDDGIVERTNGIMQTLKKICNYSRLQVVFEKLYEFPWIIMMSVASTLQLSLISLLLQLQLLYLYSSIFMVRLTEATLCWQKNAPASTTKTSRRYRSYWFFVPSFTI